MGRKGDTPELQAAKGHPGRRKSRVARRVEEQEKLAAAIAAAPATGSHITSPPAFMDDRWAGAVAIWKQYAPLLASTGRLAADFRHTFAMFCVYMAEWIECSNEIVEKGKTQKIKNVSGSLREVDRPVVRHRETAFHNAMELAKGFGLTPANFYPLLRDRAHVGPLDLFGNAPNKSESSTRAPDAPPPQTSALGALAAVNSRPPDDLLN